MNWFAELSRLTGESKTRAIQVAVEERLRRLKGEPGAMAEELLALGRECASNLQEPWKSIDHAELLYDERGLPC